MNTEEMNVALAKFCGVTCTRCKGSGKYLRFGSHDWFHIGKGQEQPEIPCDHVTEDSIRLRMVRMLPDYCNDLNAIHAVEEKLTEAQKREYASWVWCNVCDETLYDGHGHDYAAVFQLIHATAAQKAEALCRALSLWRNDE